MKQSKKIILIILFLVCFTRAVKAQGHCPIGWIPTAYNQGGNIIDCRREHYTETIITGDKGLISCDFSETITGGIYISNYDQIVQAKIDSQYLNIKYYNGDNLAYNFDNFIHNCKKVNQSYSPNNYGVGIKNPMAAFAVNGDLALTDGYQGFQYLLKTDADGYSSWSSITKIPGGLRNGDILNNPLVKNGTFISSYFNDDTLIYGQQVFANAFNGYILTMEENGVSVWAPNYGGGNGVVIDTEWLEATNTLFPSTNNGDLSLEIRLSGAGTAAIHLNRNGAAIFNENGDNVDFRVESTNHTHMFFVDASANSIGIKDSSPEALLDIANATKNFVDGNQDLLVADDLEIDGNLYATNIYANTINGELFGDTTYMELNGVTFRHAKIYYSTIYESLDFNGDASMIRTTGEPLVWDANLELKGDLNIRNGRSLSIMGKTSGTPEITFYSFNGTTGIHTTRPESALDINGSFMIRGGTPFNNALLVSSSAAGLATWGNQDNLTVGTVNFATNTGNATLANSADFADNVTNAVNVNDAVDATNATNATSADLALSVTNTNNANTTNHTDSFDTANIISSFFTNGIINGANLVNVDLGNSAGAAEWEEGADGLYPKNSAGNQTVYIGSNSKASAEIVMEQNGTFRAVKFVGDGSNLTNLPGMEWSDNGTYLYPQANSGAKTVVIGATTEANADIVLGSTASVIINEQALNSDFRIEGQNHTHLFFTDASTNMIGIKNSAPRLSFDLNGTMAFSTKTISVAAATGVTNVSNSRIIYLESSGSCVTNITSNPQIAAGVDGQIITLIGRYSDEEILLEDGAGLALNNNNAFSLKAKDQITLIYSGQLNEWLEINRTNYMERPSDNHTRGTCT